MNYLAHAYLSFNEPEIVLGNMISDFIKGSKKFDYSSGIQHGINLHRLIDNFTDTHEVVKEAKQCFKASAGLYSGAFVDVAFDHFLANDKNEFTLQQLQQFAANTYKILYSFEEALPEKFLTMLPYMQQQNWLFNYSTMQGAKNSFGGLVRRAKYLNSSEEMYAAFMQYYDFLQSCYTKFFPEVKAFAGEQLAKLLK